jgi:predicted dehydrogenase
MRFALLGDHPDGLNLARAVGSSERHELLLYSGPAAGLQHLQRHGLAPCVVADLEEVLANAQLDAVIVAGIPSERPVQLRRALQSEYHVLCVHPSDASPNLACEAAMIQADTNRVLLPILPMTLHPGVVRFAELMRIGAAPRMLEMEIWSTEEALLEAGISGHLPGWDVLRFLGGEIGEIFLHAPDAEMRPGVPLLLSGRFVSGMVFQATYLPNQAESRWRMSIVTTTGRASLTFTHGWPGPAQLAWTADKGEERAEAWGEFHPFAAMLERFEQAVDLAGLRKPMPGQPAQEALTKTPPLLGWLDELRAVELDAAARRSAHYGRSSTLDLQEATEEASFKGTMTLVGCSLIWLALIVLILAVWVHWLAWLILPVLAVFLGLQALRWILPGKPAAKE